MSALPPKADMFSVEVIGIGCALIDDRLAMAKTGGWARLYWHTRQGNETARRLYDKFAGADDFLRYRLILS